MDDNGCWIASKTVTRTASFALKKKNDIRDVDSNRKEPFC